MVYLTEYDDYLESYAKKMREAYKSRGDNKRLFWFSNSSESVIVNYWNSFKPYCSRVGNFKSGSVDPCDDNCRSYIHFRLRIYGTGDSCIIVPGWVVNRCYKRL